MKTLKMGVKQTGEKDRDNWQTPAYIMNPVSNFFRGEYLDPFPPNPTVDAFASPWLHRHLWLNPPFSRLAEVTKLGYHVGWTSLWLTHHNHDVKWFKRLSKQSLAQCLLYDRVRFIDPDTGKERGTAIGKCQTITLITPYSAELENFHDCFSHLGRIIVTYR